MSDPDKIKKTQNAADLPGENENPEGRVFQFVSQSKLVMARSNINGAMQDVQSDLELLTASIGQN